MGSVVYLKHKWNLVVVILLLADISGLISSYMSPTDLTLWNPIVRPLVFVASSPGMREAALRLVRSVDHVWDSLVLMALLLILSATIGMLLFGFSPCGTHPELISDCQANMFYSFSVSMSSMLVLLTSANYPAVMVEQYDKYSLTVLFFIAFLLIGFFFVMNLVLASLYNSFKTELDREEAIHEQNLKAGLSHAFDFLSKEGNGQVLFRTCLDVLDELERPTDLMGS
jgi:two pore calcium channel protein